MEPVTAKIAEKSRRGRREEHGNRFPRRSLRLFFALSAVKGFLTVQILDGEVSDGMQP
jgi:hypothetical protein